MRFAFFFLFLIYACSPDKPRDQQADEKFATLNLNRNYSKEELSFACGEGCQHHYKIYLNANKIVKNAVSLNQPQLDSIQKECERFCQLDVFYRLNQEGLDKLPEVLEPTIEDHQKAQKTNGEIKSLEDL